MSQVIVAIYDNGVLRPVVPLAVNLQGPPLSETIIAERR